VSHSDIYYELSVFPNDDFNVNLAEMSFDDKKELLSEYREALTDIENMIDDLESDRDQIEDAKDILKTSIKDSCTHERLGKAWDRKDLKKANPYTACKDCGFKFPFLQESLWEVA
jgi:ArsR family metal-binding transcriptional regulator